MLMKRGAMLLVVLGAVVAMASGAMAQDGQVKVYLGYYGVSGGYSGGEFDVDVVSWSSDPAKQWVSWVKPLKNTNAEFATFCVQYTQELYLDTLYNVTLATQTNHHENKPLDPGVAYLFYLWNRKALPGYDYTAGSGRTSSAKDLMEVIWKRQGYTAPYGNTDRQKQWMAIANDANDAPAVNTVRIAQLYGASHDDYQDILVEVVPEPGTMALMGCALFGVVPALRRRRRQC
jgi:hypothetical protein